MISLWGVPVPDRFFSYADAYKDSSVTMCQKIIDDPNSFSWPNGAVTLMLAAHAVELFLKGAILTRDPNFDALSKNHNIDALKNSYRSQFPDPEFEWNVPFASHLTQAERIAIMMYLNPGLTEEEVKEGRAKVKPPLPSILYRYPVDHSGNDWKGLYGFEPHGFKMLLSQLGNDFSRIKAHLQS